MIKLSRKEANIVKSILDRWEQDDTLTQEEVQRLKKKINIIPFNWKKLAKYSIWLAIVTFIISISSLIADRAIQELFQVIFNAPHYLKCIGLAIIACLLYGWGAYWQRTRPEKELITESILFLGVLATAAAVYQFGMALDTGSGHFSILLLLSFIIYGTLGILFKSTLIWVFSLISLGGWFGAETGYMSGWGAYYLGMNYPMRFVLFGGILTALAFQMPQIPWLRQFKNATLVMGLLYLFIALWILSIFGDQGDLDHWREVKQIELFHWSLLFAIVALLAIYHGIKYENDITKGFGLTFIFINLYTRFFEYFWNSLHVGIFFGILAISFWFLGSKAEKIWHVEKMVKNKE